MKADLHIHTYYSHDAINTFKDIEKHALKANINCIAITDHETIKGALNAKKNIDKVTVITGIEFYTRYGHLIGLNIDEEPKRKLTFEELIDFIRDNNGYSVMAHPLDKTRNKIDKEKIFEIIDKVDMIEVANAHDRKAKINYIILSKLAEDLDKGITAGSDSHIPDTIGYTYVVDDSENIEEFIENLLHRNVKIYVRTVNLNQRVKKLLSEALHKAKLYRPSPL